MKVYEVRNPGHVGTYKDEDRAHEKAENLAMGWARTFEATGGRRSIVIEFSELFEDKIAYCYGVFRFGFWGQLKLERTYRVVERVIWDY
ncbi:MAG: hypothetical protein LC687_06265 [Actinobacteria bacterium]|nr:hypothetical protein [Actinomycetota bacterium]